MLHLASPQFASNADGRDDRLAAYACQLIKLEHNIDTDAEGRYRARRRGPMTGIDQDAATCGCMHNTGQEAVGPPTTAAAPI